MTDRSRRIYCQGVYTWAILHAGHGWWCAACGKSVKVVT